MTQTRGLEVWLGEWLLYLNTMFSNLSAFEIVALLVSLVISLAIHEAMHGFVAHWLGDDTAQQAGRLTLNPLKHIDLLTTIILPAVMILTVGQPFLAAKPVPFNPERLKYGEFGVALVGIAGPVTNFLLAVIGAIAFHAAGLHASADVYNAIVIFVEINIAMFVFNMIPFPPLDGSRLLYAFAPEALQDVMRQIESAGFLAILVFILLIFQFIAGPIENIETHLLTFLLG